MTVRKYEILRTRLRKPEATFVRASLLAVTFILLFAPVVIADHATTARYDATAPGSVTANPSCSHPSVVCLVPPAGSTNAHLTFTDDVVPISIPVPGRIYTTQNGYVLERSSMCGSGDLRLLPGTTEILIHFFPLPQNCDFACEADCDVAAVPTRGTVSAVFTH